ncbi:MAG TPA: hypothetical protein VGR72_09560 [Candidatus Acidoferrales bacterium]|nr:hypothetical protein [Candidatus Acidoferrales bacterium]
MKTMRDLADLKNEVTAGSTLVFEGLVKSQEVKAGPIGAPSNAMSMTMRGVHRVVTIQVLRMFRGKLIGSVTVLTGIGTGDCGYDFETGKEYLVYASNVDDGVLFTSICTGTTLLEQAGPLLGSLRGDPPTADDLLDPETYYKKYEPQWTEKVCGRVVKPGGVPLAGADVVMTQLREEPLPAMSASDPNLSKPDGTFCIEGISPGKYLLTAEDVDYDANTRWMGYYPGVPGHSEAKPIEVTEGTSVSGLNFRVQNQPVFTVRFRVVTSDGSPVPLEYLRIRIDSRYTDPLAYHEDQGLENDGTCSLGFVPPGRYSVMTFLRPDFRTGKVLADVAAFQMAREEIEINGESEVVLTLVHKPEL